MEQYFVFMADLGKPLHGENPRGGEVQNFDDPTAARSFAQGQKDKWDMVLMCERGKRGAFVTVERYSKGNRAEIS